MDLIPDYPNFVEDLKAPPHNTIAGVHYGLSYVWGPNVLLWNTAKIKDAPVSWAAIYDPKYKGQVSIPIIRSRSPTRRSSFRRPSPSLGSPILTS